MVLVPGKVILDAAKKGKFGVPALNINEMLQLQAYLTAAYELKSPIILQASMGSREFTGWLPNGRDADLGARATIEMIKAFDSEYAKKYGYTIPVSVILDHGPDFKACKGAIDAGFGMVMIDGSIDYSQKVKDKNGKETHPPRSYEDNVRVTREVVEEAHKKGVSVEAEIGTLGGTEDQTAASKVKLTDPEESGRFVKDTEVDSLAVAIGTSHGAYKFITAPNLDIDLVEKIEKETGIPLVMHGSSSVPEELVKMINRYPVIQVDILGNINIRGYFRNIVGDKVEISKTPETRIYNADSLDSLMAFGRDIKTFSCMKKSMGVPMEDIQKAIQFGVCKINVDTDGRLATTGAIRQFMAQNPDGFDQRGYFKAARQALYDIASDKIKGFGSANHTDDVEMISLEQMAKRYSGK